MVAAFDRMTAHPLWPGFEPARIPLAIFDGRDTFLVRHPSPPRGARRVSESPPIDRLPGRDPAITANSSAVIGGVPNATLLLAAGQERSADQNGAVLVHEAFHVFQAARHPTWNGNEAELFTYPVDDPVVLRERDLEERALVRALAAGEPGTSCWASVALEARGRRFARLGEGAIGYERGTELKEGLARYLQNRAAGEKASIVPLAPEQIRDRAYATGAALAELLDRAAPGWRETLEAGRAASLDQLLAARLAARTGPAAAAPPCGWSPAETADADRRARTAAAGVGRGRADARRAFDAAPGWRLVVTAGREPLWPQGFDPLNVRRVGAGALLHTRFLKLGNQSGTVEVLGHTSLSEAAGAHPLFKGVRRLVIGGLDREPSARDQAGALTIDADGIALVLRGARLERDPERKELRVRVE